MNGEMGEMRATNEWLTIFPFYFYLQRKRGSMPPESCCCYCSCGGKVQNKVLEARYGLGPFHNYCRKWKSRNITFNDLWPQRSFEVTFEVIYLWKHQIRGLRARYGHGPLHNNWPWRSFEVIFEVIQEYHLSRCRSQRNFFPCYHGLIKSENESIACCCSKMVKIPSRFLFQTISLDRCHSGQTDETKSPKLSPSKTFPNGHFDI